MTTESDQFDHKEYYVRKLVEHLRKLPRNTVQGLRSFTVIDICRHVFS